MELREKLKKPIEDKYLKAHPTKSFLTVISPMAVIERLNDVFGIGGWGYEVREVGPVREGTQGERKVFMADAVGTLTITPTEERKRIVIQQFGGSTNDDSGDALKGAATDALTKCASYLEIGWEIYSGEKDGPTKTVKGGAWEGKGSRKPASDKQKALIKKLYGEKEGAEAYRGDITADLNGNEASILIEKLMDLKSKKLQTEPQKDDMPF